MHFRAHFHAHFRAHFHSFLRSFSYWYKVLREYPHFCLVGFLYVLITNLTPTYQVPKFARVSSKNVTLLRLARDPKFPHFIPIFERHTARPDDQVPSIEIRYPSSGAADERTLFYDTAAAAATGEASVRIPKASGALYVFQKWRIGPLVSRESRHYIVSVHQ